MKAGGMIISTVEVEGSSAVEEMTMTLRQENSEDVDVRSTRYITIKRYFLLTKSMIAESTVSVF